MEPETQLARADWAPFDLVIFDCDSTLVTVEGIDELAKALGRETEVAALTAQAMNGDVPLEEAVSCARGVARLAGPPRVPPTS